MPKVLYRDESEISAALGASALRDVSYLRDSAHQAIVEQVRAYNAGRQEISSATRLSAQAMVDDLASLRQRVTNEIDAIEQRGKQAVERIRAAISKATQEPQDVASQTLRELQIQSGWQRAQLRLAGGDDLVDVAREAGRSGDRGMIAALRVYASAALTGQSPQIADAVMRALEQAEAPLLSTAQALCRDLQAELSVGVGNLGGCANQARATVAGTAENGYLSGWRQASALQVAPTIPGTPAPSAAGSASIF